MKKTLRHVTLIACTVMALLLGTMCAGYMQPARAIDAKDIVKVGGVLLVVNQLGGKIDHFINGLLSQRKAEVAGMTKVVPIFSVGQGAYIGAAQVVGAREYVQRVQAVAAVEGVLNKFQGTLMVPISTQMPGKNLARVQGVGISSVIDLKL